MNSSLSSYTHAAKAGKDIRQNLVSLSSDYLSLKDCPEHYT